VPFEQSSIDSDACALLLDGRVQCWGNDRFWQIRSSSLPPSAIKVAAGARHTCALLRDGSVWCWGANSAHALGFVSESRCTERWYDGFCDEPHRVPNLSGVATINERCAVARGRVICWGAGPAIGAEQREPIPPCEPGMDAEPPESIATYEDRSMVGRKVKVRGTLTALDVRCRDGECWHDPALGSLKIWDERCYRSRGKPPECTHAWLEPGTEVVVTGGIRHVYDHRDPSIGYNLIDPTWICRTGRRLRDAAAD
jgi:hypothetical protein